MRGARPRSPQRRRGALGQASDPPESPPPTPPQWACASETLFPATRGGDGEEPRFPRPRAGPSPFLPGPLGAALCLPQSAPSTKVARQVPGRRQSSRSVCAWLPETELERAGGTGHAEQEAEGGNGPEVPGFSFLRSFRCLERTPLPHLPPLLAPTWPFAALRNWTPNEKRAPSSCVPRRKENQVGAPLPRTCRLTLGEMLTEIPCLSAP